MSRVDKDALAANLRQQVAAVAEKDRATFYGLDVAFHDHTADGNLALVVPGVEARR